MTPTSASVFAIASKKQLHVHRFPVFRKRTLTVFTMKNRSFEMICIGLEKRDVTTCFKLPPKTYSQAQWDTFTMAIVPEFCAKILAYTFYTFIMRFRPFCNAADKGVWLCGKGEGLTCNIMRQHFGAIIGVDSAN